MSNRFDMQKLAAARTRFLLSFYRRPLHERLGLVWRGFTHPHDAMARREARYEAEHLLSWAAAIALPLLFVLLLNAMPRSAGGHEGSGAVTYVTRKEDEIILDDKPQPEDTERELAPSRSLVVDGPAFDPPSAEPSAVPVTPAPAPRVQAPLTPPAFHGKNMLPETLPFSTAGIGRRRLEVRKAADRPSEPSVLRALHWLKREQRADGSWQSPPPAMTGLALLCFLGHGEVPGASDAFGDTVRRGIEWLQANQGADGRFAQSDPHEYSLPIAAYALCEASAMTRIPHVRGAAQRSIAVIVQGQNPNGGWNYRCIPSQRNDTSYTGWCVQALKAANLAGIGGEPVRRAMAKAISGVQANAHPAGGFGYVGPGRSGLTGVGVLCLQMLGMANADCARAGLQQLLGMEHRWEMVNAARPLYYWYYATQARFHGGEAAWTPWEDTFIPETMAQQIVVPPETRGGAARGYWESPGRNEDYGTVYATTLCTLMLEIYYRYLPTYSAALQQAEDRTPATESPIKVNVQLDDRAG